MDTFILIVGLISIQASLAAVIMILNDIGKMLWENDDDRQDVLEELSTEDIDQMQADIDAQRVKPLICKCGERLDEDSWCIHCMDKTRRVMEKCMYRMHDAEAEAAALREKLDYWKERCLSREAAVQEVE